MPCRSDYLEATAKEVELSRVLCHHAELDGKPNYPASWYQGYHPKVYSKFVSREDADEWVAHLCSRCQQIDVTKYSLELQMWWRDHQAADAKRKQDAKEAAELEKLRLAAMAKLSPEERKALGLREDT